MDHQSAFPIKPTQRGDGGVVIEYNCMLYPVLGAHAASTWTQRPTNCRRNLGGTPSGAQPIIRRGRGGDSEALGGLRFIFKIIVSGVVGFFAFLFLHSLFYGGPILVIEPNPFIKGLEATILAGLATGGIIVAIWEMVKFNE